MKPSKKPTNRAKFDIDAQTGEVSENLALSLIRESGVTEAKRDQMCWSTGNVYIEYAQRRDEASPWEPSGITVTESTWYAIALDNRRGDIEVVIIAGTRRLKQLCRRYRKTARDVQGGDGKNTRGVLLPLKELADPNL